MKAVLKQVGCVHTLNTGTACYKCAHVGTLHYVDTVEHFTQNQQNVNIETIIFETLYGYICANAQQKRDKHRTRSQEDTRKATSRAASGHAHHKLLHRVSVAPYSCAPKHIVVLRAFGTSAGRDNGMHEATVS